MPVTGHDAASAPRRLGPLALFLLSVLVGAIAAVGAWIFRMIIGLFHNLFFLGKFAFLYDAGIHTPPSPWGAAVILVPVVGGMAVAFLVQNFAPEAKGHGVPEVMDAIFFQKGKIRPVVAVIKSLASALSIGSGASVGREGPIVQIASAFGSSVGQFLRLPVWQRIAMIAAGAGGGIAATFNTPVGGVLFAVELLLPEISVRTILPVTISTATAAYLGQLFFSPHPSFMIPAFQQPYFAVTNPEVLIGYLVLGALCGVASAIYIHSIYACEDLFERLIPRSYYLRHGIGMLLLGAILYLLFKTTGHYHVEGVGYATIQDVLMGTISPGGVLILLFALKMLATSLSLGSGSSGGVFSPALFVGATLGGGYGLFLHGLFPGLGINAPAFAVAGMAGIVGASTGAALTAIVMILEMTYDYSVVIPLVMTVAMSYGVRTFLSRDSIYTLKLTRRGEYLPEGMHANVHDVSRVEKIVDRSLTRVPAETPVAEFRALVAEQGSQHWFVVEGKEAVQSVASRSDAIAAVAGERGETTVGELLKRRFSIVGRDATLLQVIRTMKSDGTDVVAVVGTDADPASGLVGIIGKDNIVDAMADALDLFSHESGRRAGFNLLRRGG